MDNRKSRLTNTFSAMALSIPFVVILWIITQIPAWVGVVCVVAVGIGRYAWAFVPSKP